MPDGFLPELGPSTQALIRAAYGALMTATLLQALPEARRFFVSERWGGYAKSQPDVDAIQNPVVMPPLLALWLGSALALTVGWGTVWAALINLAFCRYFYVHMRWKGILRGMGAPGFMAYWLALVVCLLEVSRRWAPDVQPVVVLVAQIDLAFIMLSAGVYKFTAGYPQNHGMELGLCNPMWGYWWRWYVKRRPSHPVFWTMNQLAWGTEVVAALLMLVPATRELGALLLIVSFAFIATQIRLGFLTEMVMVAGLVYMAPEGAVGSRIESMLGLAPQLSTTAEGGLVGTALTVALWTYLALLPLAHAGLYYNFYGHRALPAPLQRALERYTNFFGIIIWRVFSVDLVNFFIRLSRRRGATTTPISRLGAWPRFNHVGEMICLTSLFTTLKYYPGNERIFEERVLRYAKTLPHESGDEIVFEYISVVKRRDRFDWILAGTYEVDPVKGTVTERWLDKSVSPRRPHDVSPVHEGVVPGSYVPARR